MITEEQKEQSPSPTPPEPTPKDGNPMNHFINKMRVPREEISIPPPPPSAVTDADLPPDEPITDDDAGNLNYLDYSPEHRTTALVFIGMIDTGFGFLGMMISGMDPERYQQFAKKEPPEYYVHATAALVKKYQARLSIEMMFFSALLMIYAPAVNKARVDRKTAQEAEMRARIKEEAIRSGSKAQVNG